MAKLSTPAHPCFVRYVRGDGTPTGQGCPTPAYRRDSQNRWACRRHNDKLAARQGRQPLT